MSRFQSKRIQNSGSFIILNLLNTSIPFLILPFLLAYLTPIEMGILGTFNILYSLLQNIVGLGSFTQIQKEFITRTKNDFQKLLFNNYFISFLFVGLLNLVTVCIPEVFFKQTLSKEIIIVAINGAFLYQIANSSLLIIQQKKEIKIYGTLIIVATLLNFLFSLYLLKIELGVLGRTIGIATAQLFLVITIRTLKLDGISFFSISIKSSISNLKHGVSFLPFQIGNWANKNLHKLIVLNMSSLEVFGAYTLGTSLSRGVSLPISSIIQGLKPYNNDDLSNGNNKRVTQTGLYIFLFGLAILLCTFLMLDPLLNIVDRENNYSTYKSIFLLLFIGAAVESFLLYFKGIWVYLGRKNILNIQAAGNLILALVFLLFSMKNMILYIELGIILNMTMVIHSAYYLNKQKI